MTRPQRSSPRKGVRSMVGRSVLAGAGLAAAGILLIPGIAGAAEVPSEPAAATLGTQVNLLWVVIGAVLVIFMQAGFALVETGFCRAKHAAHVVVTNFAIFGLGFVGYFLVGYALMFGGFSTSLIGYEPAGRRGAARLRPVGLPVEGRLGADRYRQGRSALGGGRLLPLHGGVHGHDRHDPDRVDGGALEVEGIRRLGAVLRGDLLPAVRRLDLGRRLAEPARQLDAARASATSTSPGPASCTPSVAWPRLAGALVLGPRIGKFNKDGSANTHAGPPHPDGVPGLLHPAVRLVRLQRRLDVRGDRHPVRHGRGQHRARCRVRCHGGDVLVHDTSKQEARPGHDGQRHAGRPGGDHCALRLRRPAGRRRSSAPSPACSSCWPLVHREASEASTTRSAPSPSTASAASAACCASASSPTASTAAGVERAPVERHPRATPPASPASSTGRRWGQLGAQAIGAVVHLHVMFGIAFAFFKIQNAIMKGGIRPTEEDELERHGHAGDGRPRLPRLHRAGGRHHARRRSARPTRLSTD